MAPAPRNSSRERVNEPRTKVQASRLEDFLVAEVRATVNSPPGPAEREEGEEEDHGYGRVGVQVRDLEGRVAGRVHGVEDRVEERRHPQGLGQHPDRVEDTAEEGEGLDHDVGQKGDVLYPGRHGAYHRAQGREGE